MQEGRRKYPGMSALELIHIYYFGWGLSLFVVFLNCICPDPFEASLGRLPTPLVALPAGLVHSALLLLQTPQKPFLGVGFFGI